MAEKQKLNRPHHAPHAGVKIKKKQTEESKKNAKNFKAFNFKSMERARKSARRTEDIRQNKLHLPTTGISTNAPPIVISIVGPPKVGKTTLLKSLIRHYTRTLLKPKNIVEGPVSIVVSKNRRFTFIECPTRTKANDNVVSDISALIDIAKISDIVLLLIDGSFGFEMETFEFLSIANVSGMPKVIGILNHLDCFTKQSTISSVKKQFKKRFWNEICDGAKLFYLSGASKETDLYLPNEIKNLARFLSVIKSRPLTWKSEHPYLLIDRLEDLTPPGLLHNDSTCDRTISLYGYVRGTNLLKSSTLHFVGVGDFKINSISSVEDPCPLSKEHVRKLNMKQRFVYAPMTNLGDVIFDGDTTIIDIKNVALSDPSTLISNDNDENNKAPTGEGIQLIKDLQKIQVPVDQKLHDTPMQFFKDSAPLFDKNSKIDQDQEDGIKIETLEEQKKNLYQSIENIVNASDSRNRRRVGDPISDNMISNEISDNHSVISSSDNDDDSQNDEEEVENIDHELNFPLSKWHKSISSSIYDEDNNSDINNEDDNYNEKKQDLDFFKVKQPSKIDIEINKDDSSKPIIDPYSLPQFNPTELKNAMFVTGDWNNDNKKDESNSANESEFEIMDSDQKELQEDDDDISFPEDKDSEIESSNEEEKDSDEDEKKDSDEDEKKESEDRPKSPSYKGRRLGESKADARRRMLREKLQKKQAFDEEYDSGKIKETDRIDELKETIVKENFQHKTILSEMNDNERIQFEGFTPGSYCRVVVQNVPCEFITNFDLQYPIILGGVKIQEESAGYNLVRFRKHRWHPKILKSFDPLYLSIGWRRFQSIPVYCMQDVSDRFRFLKYTPEYLHCFSVFYGPFFPPGSGVVGFQQLSNGPTFRINATGVVIKTSQSFKITKKLKLTGYPEKIFKNTAFIKDMFSSSLEVAKFEGATIRTVSGVRGSIKKPEGERGAFRATFEDKIVMSDIVFCRTWIDVHPVQFYDSVNSLLLSDKTKGWQGIKTMYELRKQNTIPVKNNPDSLYTPIERSVKHFNPLHVPPSVLSNLPFASKPKLLKKRSRQTYAERSKVPLSAEERAGAKILQQAFTIKKEKIKKTKESEAEKQAKKQKIQLKEDRIQKEASKESKKRFFIKSNRYKKTKH